MLKIHVASLDEVDEADRRHYERTDDGYDLIFEGLSKLKNLAKLGKRSSAAQLLQQLEAENAALREKGRARPPRESMSALDRFFADAEDRLEGLDGDARTAELAKITAELEPVLAAEVAEIDRTWQGRADVGKRTIRSATIENAARRFILDVGRPGADVALLPHVIARLDCEERDGEFHLFVKDATGNRSTMGLEGLADEFRATPALSPVVRGSTADDAAAHQRRVAETLGQKPK